MDALTKRKLTIVTTSILFGLLADIVVYSLAESKGKPFALHMPKGKNLAILVAVGIVTGLVVDSALKAVDNYTKTPEQKKLDALADADIKKIYSGELKGKTPTEIVWVAEKA